MLRNSVYRGKFNIEVLELTFGLVGFYLALRLNGVRINGIDCVISNIWNYGSREYCY